MANVLIIGGGLSGLSAGITALKSGHSVTICESHSVVGGNLTGWKRGGYTIDNCVHWLTGTNPNSSAYKTWQDLGAIKNGVYIPDSLFTYKTDRGKITLFSDAKKFEKELLFAAPEDEDGIREFLSAVNAVRKITGTGGENCDEKGGAFDLIRSAPLLIKYHFMSTKELSDRFSSALLRGFFRSLLGDGFSALAFVFVCATITGKNGGLPIGGSLAAAGNAAERFTALGGELLLGKKAVKVNVRNKKAVSADFSDGTTIYADYFILTPDPSAVFGKLIDDKMPRAFIKLYNSPKYVRFSSFHCAFACGINDLSFKGDLIVDVPEKHKKLLRYGQIVFREFSHESGFAPEGMTVVQSMVFCDEKYCKEFISLKNSPREYAEKKRLIAEAAADILTENCPAARGKLKLIDVWTPATYNRYTGAETGSYMSFTMPPKRLPVKISPKIKGIRNAFLATQWQQPPGGLPNAAEVGRRAAKAIDQAERFSLGYPTESRTAQNV